jgi:glucokinase
MIIVAADVGGTKTWFMCAGTASPQEILFQKRYLCGDFDRFEPMLKTFLDDSGMQAEQIAELTLALPGPVSADSAQLTNLSWQIDKQRLVDEFGVGHVEFINDFQASALGTCQLQSEDYIVLNAGISSLDSLKKNPLRVAVGAGTGLGLSWLQNADTDDCTAFGTEGGHIDFAPADATQIRLLQFLQESHAHVSYERILSGEGLVSLYAFCAANIDDEHSPVGAVSPPEDITAEWVSRNAENDAAAKSALQLFVRIYGAYIGNIALLFKPQGGIYITGGIAGKIIDHMRTAEFIEAYLGKGRMRELVEQIAVCLVTNDRVGVLGAMSEADKQSRSYNV